MAGTNGFYLPYILRTVGDQSQAMSVALQAGSFLLVALGVAFVFMPFVDRVNQKAMFMVGATLQIFALLLFALFDLSLAIALGYVTLLGVGGGFAQQSCGSASASGASSCRRSRPRGSTRWPWILTGFVTASALLGLFLAPSNAGKSLDEIQEEQTGEPEPTRRFERRPTADRPPAHPRPH